MGKFISTILLYLIFVQTPPSFAETSPIDAVLREAWQISPEQGFLDVSDRLLHLHLNKECKDALVNKTRKIYLFTYPSDHLRVKGYISFSVDKKTHAPVLFFLRGGHRFFGLMNPANSLSCYGPYTVIGLSYRDSVSPGVDQFGGDDVRDVKNLIAFFPELATRLGISTTKNRYLLGASRGGMQMFLALNRYPEIRRELKSAMSLSGVLDLSAWLKERPLMADILREDFGLSKENEQQFIELRNPLKNISNIPRDLPIIIVQAGKDQRVNNSHGKKMINQLLKEGFHSINYREFKKADHALSNIHEDAKKIWRLFGEE